MLHSVINDTQSRLYCGPTAIAALTGLPASEVRRLIQCMRGGRERRISGSKGLTLGGDVLDRIGRKKPIRAMYSAEVLEILRRVGKHPKKSRMMFDNHTTLNQFCDDMGHMGPFLVEVTHHFVCVSHGQICDTFTGCKPIPFSEYRKMKYRVRQWWRF